MSKRNIGEHTSRKKIKDVRRLQLLAANIDAIAKHGLSETTISHVAEIASMSRGIVNFYFKSKEIMMSETLTHLLQEQSLVWQTVRTKAEGKPAEEILRLVISSLFAAKLCSRKRLSVWTAFLAHSSNNTKHRQEIATENKKLDKELADLLQAAGGDAESSGQLSSLIRGLWLELLTQDSNDTTREMLENHAQDFLSQLLDVETPVIAPVVVAPVVEKKTAVKKPKKPASEAAIGDLFSF